MKSLADYVAQEESEMNLKEGDEIRVRYKDASGWWEGEIVSSAGDTIGTYGWFPSNYVQQKYDLFTIAEADYDYASPRTARSSAGSWTPAAAAAAAAGDDGGGGGGRYDAQESYTSGLAALEEEGAVAGHKVAAEGDLVIEEAEFVW